MFFYSAIIRFSASWIGWGRGKGRESRPEATNRKERLTGRGIKENSRYLGNCTRLVGLEIKKTEGRKGSSNYFSILLIGLVRDRDFEMNASSVLLDPSPRIRLLRFREFPESFGVILFFNLAFWKTERKKERDFQSSFGRDSIWEEKLVIVRNGNNNSIRRKKRRIIAIEASLPTVLLFSLE